MESSKESMSMKAASTDGKAPRNISQGRATKRSIVDSRRAPQRVRRSQRMEKLLRDRETSQSDTCRISIPQSSQRSNWSFESPSSPTDSNVSGGSALSEHKRRRPGLQNLHVASAASPDKDVTVSSMFPLRQHQLNQTFSCQSSLMDEKKLLDLISRELDYHPNNAFLYYVDPEAEDKVDAVLRNEAVNNLRFMHTAFFNLPTEVFCKAVNLIDRFIVKVKVKRKYMACVATASYRVASRLCYLKDKDVELLDPEMLVHITQCGGNAADLLRMEEILGSKLSHDFDGVNALDFLRIFSDCVVETDSVHQEKGGLDDTKENITCAAHEAKLSDSNSKVDCKCLKMSLRAQLTKHLVTLMETSLCYLEVYRFRPACLALGILAQCDIAGLAVLADMCGVDWLDVMDCADLVEKLQTLYFRDRPPRNRRPLVWTLSRRTLFRIGYSTPTPLDTISEDYEPVDEDEWFLPLLLEP